jgi:hypothetical protein
MILAGLESALGVKLSPPTGCYGISAWVSTAWFAHDPALEGGGFEPSVPLRQWGLVVRGL